MSTYPKPAKKKTVLVAGGGFFGSAVANILDQMQYFHVILLDTKEYFEYTYVLTRLNE
jgi:NADH dehydrogenase FAD-containing subunit